MKLLAIDLDGTLLRTDCRISDYSRNVLNKALKHDIMIIPASGRCFRSVMKLLSEVEGLSYVIGSGGSTITSVKGKKLIHQDAFPPKLASEIFHHIFQKNNFVSINSGNDAYIQRGSEDVMYSCGMDKILCDNLMETYVRLYYLDRSIYREILPVNKICIASIDPEELSRCLEWLNQFNEVVCNYSTKDIVEISLKKSNKGNALDLLCNSINDNFDNQVISKEDIIAIGDSMIDIDMIQYAHLGIAVDNAMEEVKKVADRIIASNDEDGPAHLIETIINKIV